MPDPRLRPMTPADIEAASAAILADDWGDRHAWFTFAVGHEACDVVVADVDGEIVGSGVTTRNGSVAWIGTIWVAPGWRGRGLGRKLTEATIAAAESAGARTLVLVATEAGRPLYERLGFRVTTTYQTMEAPGRLGQEVSAPGSASPGSADGGSTAGPGAGREARVVRAFRPADLAAMIRLDAAATGEDRGLLLAAFATSAST
ncbi:MAG: GNAT family N-acetyltransferase, partial [Candidatus Limnocylindrales bacterium]